MRQRISTVPPPPPKMLPQMVNISFVSKSTPLELVHKANNEPVEVVIDGSWDVILHTYGEFGTVTIDFMDGFEARHVSERLFVVNPLT